MLKNVLDTRERSEAPEISTTLVSGEKTKHSDNRSWRALILILCSLLVGLAFALGHHLLYRSYDGQPVSDVAISQSWIIRLGTLLAILAKLLFSVSAGVAFVQLQWQRFYCRSTSVKDLDTVSGMLSDILNLLKGPMFRFPVLALMALGCWLLPIIPVITSGTITVVQAPRHKIYPTIIPQLDLYNDTFNPWIATSYVSMRNIPPMASLSQAAIATAMTGKVLPIAATFPNSSYTLSFMAPGIECEDADSTVIAGASAAWGSTRDEVGDLKYWTYIAWVPGDPWVENLTSTTPATYPMNVDLTSEGSSYVFIMTNGAGNPYNETTGQQIVQVTQCTFQNASYTADFTFVNGAQTVNITDQHIIGNISFHDMFASDSRNRGGHPGRNAYTAIAASLGSLLIGSQYYDGNGPGTTTEFTSIELLSPGEYLDPQIGVKNLLQNIILSMLSVPDFTKNDSLPVDVTVTGIVPTYSYEALYLLLTYGLALLFTTICSSIGVYAFFANDRNSYQNIPSTFLRATSSSEVHRLIAQNDKGADPRPPRLSAAVIDLTRSEPLNIDGAGRQSDCSYVQREFRIQRKPLLAQSPIGSL